jgi:hypothetical protein
MTIAIVPTLVKLPIRATPAEGAANGAAAMPTADISADFASILRGLPVAVGKSVPEQEATASGEAVMAESTIAAGDPALLTPFSPPSLNQPGSSQGAVGQEFELSRQTRPDPLMTATLSRIVREPRQEPLKIEDAAGDRQQQSPSGASAADDQPAKFAVAAFTAPPAERIVPNRPEAGSPTSVLNTLPSAPTPVSGAVSHDIPHHLQTELRDPAWASEFGQKLLWFASNEKQLAQLTLHPPQLGSIEITRGIDNSGPEAGSPANPLNTLPSAPTPVSGAVSHDIPHHLQTELRDPAWASEFGQKLLWFASNEKQLAQLTLHPPQLGSIEITRGIDNSGPEAGSPANPLNTLPSAPTPVNGAVSHDIPHHLQTPLRDPAWASEFGQKLLWFASNEKQLAQLTLHPPQLGSIEITLNLDKDIAKAHFVSSSADVRGAIETAAPRLREMFASAGIELGQVSVGSESLPQQQGGRQEPSHRPRPLADNAILGIASAGDLQGQSFANRRGQGLIDVFA